MPNHTAQHPAPADGHPSLSLFMPTYNSAAYIRDSIDRVMQLLSANFGRFELVVVDDGSQDDTCAIVECHPEAAGGNLRLIRFHNGPSRRENLALAMLGARYGYIFFIDSDLSPDIRSIPSMMRCMTEHHQQVVIGSRNREAASNRLLYRRFLSEMYNRTVRLLFNSPYADHNCGLKGFTREAYTAISHRLGHDTDHRRGWFWDVELLIVARQIGLRVHEHPVRWTESPSSTFSLIRELKVVPYMVRLRLRPLSGRLQ